MTTESTSADDATRRDGSRLSEGLGPLLAEADMEALKAVAHQAGLEGIDLRALARVLDAAQRVAVAPLRAEIADALHAMRAYARDNPRHEYQGATQDPNGVHAWLARNDRA